MWEFMRTRHIWRGYRPFESTGGLTVDDDVERGYWQETSDEGDSEEDEEESK